jgi:hypothetical protein
VSLTGLKELLIHNEHQTYAFVEVRIKLYLRPGQQTPNGQHFATSTHQLVVGPSETVRFALFDQTVFDHYDLDYVKAEDDPK